MRHLEQLPLSDAQVAQVLGASSQHTRAQLLISQALQEAAQHPYAPRPLCTGERGFVREHTTPLRNVKLTDPHVPVRVRPTVSQAVGAEGTATVGAGARLFKEEEGNAAKTISIGKITYKYEYTRATSVYKVYRKGVHKVGMST
jgi:hypothetical protein